MSTTKTLRRTQPLPRLAETVATLSEQLHETITRSLREAAGIVAAPLSCTQTMPAVVQAVTL